MKITPKSIIKDVLPLLKSSNTNSLKGFTLAEILISLLILGVIASLTIPSLIQNTHKKEEQVKVKKGLSVLNQAIAMDKALTGEDLSQYKVAGNYNATNENISNMFKKRISITEVYDGVFRTSDGFIFYCTPGNYNSSKELSSSNKYMDCLMSTLPISLEDAKSSWDMSAPYEPYINEEKITGWYRFYCSSDRCIPDEASAAKINAADPTKCRWSGDKFTCD